MFKQFFVFLGSENAQLKRQIVRPVEDIVTCHTGTSFLLYYLF